MIISIGLPLTWDCYCYGRSESVSSESFRAKFAVCWSRAESESLNSKLDCQRECERLKDRNLQATHTAS